MLTSRSKKGLKKQRTEIVFMVLMVDRRDGGRVRVLSYGMWLMWFGIPTSTKGGTSSFLSTSKYRAEREKGVMGLVSSQTLKIESDSSL